MSDGQDVPSERTQFVPTRLRPGEATRSLPDAPPQELRFKRRASVVRSLGDLWRNREIVRSLTERQLRSRYKQATLGFAWALAGPLSLLVVFVLLNRVADIDTNGAPYVLFSFIGLLAWTFFSTSVNSGATSLLSNTSLLNKMACPRELFPVSSLLVAGIDTVVASSVLVILFAVEGTLPEPTIYWVPLLMLVQILFTLGVTLVFAISVVYLRDVRHALPLIMQVGLLATPVAYSLDVIPPEWRPLYSLANPLGPVIDGYRRALLENRAPEWDLLGLAAITTVLVLSLGFWLFKRLEGGVIDVS
jgi:ABC-type polysaccharide/polyol phosphate export permease